MDYGVVISGVLTLVLGQALLRFVLKPIQNFNRERGDMSFLLIYFGSATVERSKRIKDDDYNLGLIGASLVACAAQIPFYNALAAVPPLKLPSKSALLIAATEAVNISDRIQKETKISTAPSIDSELAKIATLLKTPIPQLRVGVNSTQ
jgi:hypothetical protein